MGFYGVIMEKLLGFWSHNGQTMWCSGVIMEELFGF